MIAQPPSAGARPADRELAAAWPGVTRGSGLATPRKTTRGRARIDNIDTASRLAAQFNLISASQPSSRVRVRARRCCASRGWAGPGRNEFGIRGLRAEPSVRWQADDSRARAEPRSRSSAGACGLIRILRSALAGWLAFQQALEGHHFEVLPSRLIVVG